MSKSENKKQLRNVDEMLLGFGEELTEKIRALYRRTYLPFASSRRPYRNMVKNEFSKRPGAKVQEASQAPQKCLQISPIAPPSPLGSKDDVVLSPFRTNMISPIESPSTMTGSQPTDAALGQSDRNPLLSNSGSNNCSSPSVPAEGSHSELERSRQFLSKFAPAKRPSKESEMVSQPPQQQQKLSLVEEKKKRITQLKEGGKAEAEAAMPVLAQRKRVNSIKGLLQAGVERKFLNRQKDLSPEQALQKVVQRLLSSETAGGKKEGGETEGGSLLSIINEEDKDAKLETSGKELLETKPPKRMMSKEQLEGEAICSLEKHKKLMQSRKKDCVVKMKPDVKRSKFAPGEDNDSCCRLVVICGPNPIEQPRGGRAAGQAAKHLTNRIFHRHKILFHQYRLRYIILS